MIVKWFLDFLATVWHGVMSAIPDIPLPDWFTGSGGWLDTLFQEAGSMSVWINLPLVLSIGTIILACLLLSAAVKIARIVISLVAAGGGSAG